MTGRELKEWIEKNNVLDMEFTAQCRDSGGDYIGEEDTLYLIIEKEKNKVIL